MAIQVYTGVNKGCVYRGINDCFDVPRLLPRPQLHRLYDRRAGEVDVLVAVTGESTKLGVRE